MKTCIAALAFLGAAACATTGVDPRLEYTYNSSVTGVIVVPEATASDRCSNLNVFATVDDGSQPIGRTSLHSSKNRCSYQIDNLPSGKAVNVKVEAAGNLKCQDGTPMAFASDVTGPLTLESNAGKLQDFRAQCGVTKS